MKNIILGFKHAWGIPSLPPKIEYFYNHIFTRIFRFIGGVTLLLILTQKYDLSALDIINFNKCLRIEIIFYFISIYAIVFIIFTVFIGWIKIIYTLYLLFKRPEIFEVRNSPLNLLATHLAKILACVKIGCVVTGTTAAVVAGGVTFDTVIEKTGRGPIFFLKWLKG